MNCRMTFHIVGREKKEVPCCNHGPDCGDKPIACPLDSVCGICGLCHSHCLGHSHIRTHLKIANRVPREA